MNNVSCTGQCDIIKKGMIQDNNNPNEITIVDSLVDKSIFYYYYYYLNRYVIYITWMSTI